MQTIIDMSVKVEKDEAIKIITANRELHKKVVEEARAGYVKQAQKELASRMEKLAGGEVVPLHFNLRVPEDHTSDYDTAIRMLELHQDDCILMDTATVRQLIEDEWGWSDHFWSTNSNYSKLAEDTCINKGLILPQGR